VAERGMGRGLAAILPESGTEGDELRELPVELIRPNPDQPRSRIEPEALQALAESIAEAGVVQPLLVRAIAGGTYELVAGERRWRAAKEAGLERVPAIIRDDDESQRLQTALVENMAREDLNAVDQARACAALVEDLGLSREEVARRVGRSRASISNLVRLLDLPDEALALIESGELSEGHGRAILQAKGNDVRRRLASDAVRAGWSVRETERRARGAGASKPRRARKGPSADERAAMRDAEEALSVAFGAEVRVRKGRSGVTAEVHFGELDELLGLAYRIGRKRAA
jgi:ParB family transcriptional regulator, chromosome partitioning protein